MVKLGVQGGPKYGIEEDVYIEMAYSNKKYYGKTDSEGHVIFLLPKKREYVVSFKYQTHADVIDLTEFRQGVGEKQQTIQYKY